MSRLILPDCCEDWILQYGKFYGTGALFRCLECGTEWRKEGPGTFVETASGTRFVEVVRRSSEGAEFAYLAAVGRPNPITERCCELILVRYGPQSPLTDLTCPICGTTWRKEQRLLRGFNVLCFTHSVTGEVRALQQGRTRRYLVPLDEYTPPLE